MIWLVIALLIAVFLFYASYSISAGIYLKAICRIPTTEKIVYLSFDDGPHPVQTPKILDTLNAYQAKACFFCIGENIKGNEQLLRRIDKEGHLIGNHSFSHTSFFPVLSKSKMNEDLAKCDDLLFNVLDKHTKLFRPPFGVTNPRIARVVKERGYRVIGWNIRTFDTQTKDIDKVIRRIDRHLKPGSIILLHDRLEYSAEMLQQILQHLSKKGYKFGKLPDSALHL